MAKKETTQPQDTGAHKDDKFVILHSEGGHGKQVMATAVCRAIKKNILIEN